MGLITIMAVGNAVLVVAVWAFIIWVSPLRRTPPSVESDREATDQRTILLVGLLLVLGLVLAALLYFVR